MFSARFLRTIGRINGPEEAERFLRQDRYWRAEVIGPLLQRSDDLVALKPKQALRIAEIALELVNRMRSPTDELRAHAHCALATAQRETGKLETAESNYALAETLAARCSTAVRAMVLRQKAVLLIERGDLPQALEHVTRAVVLDEAGGIFPAKSYMVKGVVLYYQGDIEGSTGCWMKILEGGDPANETFEYAMKNMVMSVVERPLLAAEIVEARKSLRTVADRIRGIRQTPVRYQIWYTEGCLHAALEEYREAVNHFMQARKGFLRIERILDFGRVSIDLIAALVKAGKQEKAYVVLQRSAKEIAQFDDQDRLAEAFRQAQRLPISEAAQHLRRHVISPGGQGSSSP